MYIMIGVSAAPIHVAVTLSCVHCKEERKVIYFWEASLVCHPCFSTICNFFCKGDQPEWTSHICEEVATPLDPPTTTNGPEKSCWALREPPAAASNRHLQKMCGSDIYWRPRGHTEPYKTRNSLLTWWAWGWSCYCLFFPLHDFFLPNCFFCLPPLQSRLSAHSPSTSKNVCCLFTPPQSSHVLSFISLPHNMVTLPFFYHPSLIQLHCLLFLTPPQYIFITSHLHSFILPPLLFPSQSTHTASYFPYVLSMVPLSYFSPPLFTSS